MGALAWRSWSTLLLTIAVVGLWTGSLLLSVAVIVAAFGSAFVRLRLDLVLAEFVAVIGLVMFLRGGAVVVMNLTVLAPGR